MFLLFILILYVYYIIFFKEIRKIKNNLYQIFKDSL